MKARIRIPTKTQYAFIEGDVEGTAQEIVEAYNELSSAYWNQGSGLKTSIFNAVMDRYLYGDGKMLSEEYEQMDDKQKGIIQAIKRAKARHD